MRRLVLGLLLTAGTALAQHAIGVRILFGVSGKIDDKWDGSVQAEGARVTSVEPWRFDDGDAMVSDHAWKAAIHDDRNANPQQQANPAINGVVVFLDSANPDAILAVHTAQGDFRLALRDLAFGTFKVELNGKAMADKIPGYQQLTDSPEEQDFPAAAVAYYILSHDDPASVDPEWQTHIGYLLDRSRSFLGRGPFFGAWAIDEQEVPAKSLPFTSGRGCCSRAGLSCRTAYWGAINAMFYEKTGDGTARENAFRSLNYATYFAASDGKIACCGAGASSSLYWFEDGYADAGRSFIWGMGAIPEFGPIGQDHLLRSSSVVQKVSYAKRKIEFQTFDKTGTEVFRLSFKPSRIVAGGAPLAERKDLNEEGYTTQPLAGGDYVVRIHHTRSNMLSVSGGE